MTTNTDIKTKFIELRAKGYSFEYIAKSLNKSKQTLINWNKEFENEIANLKAVELESLFEACFVMKQQRIKLLSSNLKLMQDELAKRDLADINTDKLMDLIIKSTSLLKDEYIDLTFKSDDEISRNKSFEEEIKRLTVWK